MAEPCVHCELWEDDPEERDDVVNALLQHMEDWQCAENQSRLSTFLLRTPFFERSETLAVTLRLYSTGRRPIGCEDQPWQQEILSMFFEAVCSMTVT